MLKSILLGLFVCSIGFVCVYFSDPISKTIGKWNRAEQYLGGTRQGIIIIGFLVFVLGVLIAFGTVKMEGGGVI